MYSTVIQLYILHVSILFQILFQFRFLQNSEQSSLCSTVGPCWLSILNIAVCTCQSQMLFISCFPTPDLRAILYYSSGFLSRAGHDMWWKEFWGIYHGPQRGPPPSIAAHKAEAKKVTGVLSCHWNRRDMSEGGSNPSPGLFSIIGFKTRNCSYWSRSPPVGCKSGIRWFPMTYLFINQINRSKFWFLLVQLRHSGNCLLDKVVTSALLWWYLQFIDGNHGLSFYVLLN